MTKADSKTFRIGELEAVRLPTEVAFGRDVELTIVRSGEVLTIFPRRPSISDLVERLSALPQPREVEVRDDDPL